MKQDFYDRTFIENCTTICYFLYFRNLQCIDQDCFSSLRKLQDQPVDFCFCTYINSLCGLIQKQDICICIQPSCQKDFLLISSAE